MSARIRGPRGHRRVGRRHHLETDGALASTPSIRILDLSGVRFIDPSGLRILLDIVRADPQLVIRAPSASVRRLCSLAASTTSPPGRGGARAWLPVSAINVTGSRSMRPSAALEGVVMDVRARLRSLLEHAAIDDPGRAGDVAGATDEARNATTAAISHSHDWPPASLQPRRDRPHRSPHRVDRRGPDPRRRAAHHRDRERDRCTAPATRPPSEVLTSRPPRRATQ